MSERFFAPPPWNGPSIELTGPESHHLATVLRLRPGDRVTLFDGAGTEAVAEIAAVGKRAATLQVVSRQTTARPAPPLILAAAVPKGDRFRWLVEKATELGVDQLIPLDTSRSVVEPGRGKLDRMHQTVIAACKQCGRNHLMEIRPPSPWDELLTRELPRGIGLIAHPDGEPLMTALASLPRDRPLLLIVGPEGGFTPDEIAQVRAAGIRTVHLGPHILRIETAAVSLAAAAALWRG